MENLTLEEKIKTLPPLIKEWAEIQLKHRDSVVLVEVGAFFECWQIDNLGHAKKASQILDIVLTRRDKSQGDKSPLMAGFPSISSANHIRKLVEAGLTVVVVSQSVRGKRSDQNKKIQRQITQIISPGTIVENIASEKSNYFASLYFQDKDVGVSLIDVSTGEVIISEMQTSQLNDFLEIKAPSEILILGDVGNYIVHKKNIKLFTTSLIQLINSTLLEPSSAISTG
jgi:DNA mismatch repair protein MutS